uniref:Monodehydroascorbate reductase n=1 Tax=Tanacetum cinerariifolium TaxID=118510 RepID=A0A6L2M1N7_TANCI|nr:hypothetical protein [Tanacetum cinerariifolium]
MADVNVNALVDQAPTMAPPNRTDDQILPHIRWDSVQYDKTVGCYKCQLDEQWFDLTKDTLRDALQITPVNNNKTFYSPPSSDALINFINELGYPKLVKNLSKVVTNDMFQPWRALTTIINLCLTGKTSGFERPSALLGSTSSIRDQILCFTSLMKNRFLDISSSVLREPIEKYLRCIFLGKKRKLVTEIFDKPSPARKSRSGLVTKRRKPTSSLRSVDESVAEGIPEKEPRVDDEEADVQRALEESLKSIYDAPWCSLPPVVIREPERQRRSVMLINISFKGAPPHLLDPLARPNPGDAAVSQPLPSPVVHAGSNLKHMDLEGTDVSTQPHPKKMDEGFTAMANLKVHENLKLTVEEQVILEEPASSRGTLSSLQHLTKDLIFGDLFFNDKPSEADNEKTTTETEAESMVSVTIQKRYVFNPSHENIELLKDLSKARKKKKKRCDSPKMPLGFPPHQLPPPPLPPGPSGASGSPRVFGSSETAASAKYQAWTTTDTRLRPSISLTPADLQMDDDMAPDAQAQSSDDEDIGNAHIPKVNLRQDWWKPLKEERHATPEPAWSIPSSDVPYQIEECHKLLTDSVDDLILKHNVSKPLPLGGPPGQMKAAYYPDVGLEQMVPDQMWIKEEYTSEGDRRAVRTYMRILSVVRIEVFSMYGYDYIKMIVLRRADLNEHIITEQDFKYLYPSDFEDLYPLNLQGFEYKHDYTVIDSPRAITFQDKYGVQMIMRFNEIHKFSDGTLHQIDEALDYRVKEFKVNWMNLGLNTRFWTRKDVDRSKEFMFAIQKRLKTRRIFRNLESFVGGRVRDGDYRLLKLIE